MDVVHLNAHLSKWKLKPKLNFTEILHMIRIIWTIWFRKAQSRRKDHSHPIKLMLKKVREIKKNHGPEKQLDSLDRYVDFSFN